jgi:hypothetical protein
MINRDIEDRLINPLNNIIVLSYGTEEQKKIEKEIDRIMDVLVDKGIVSERLKKVNKK